MIDVTMPQWYYCCANHPLLPCAMQVCPYFLSRDLAGSADIIFMPYNYLVDSSSRSQLSTINWTNAVIIVDEAHNIQVSGVSVVLAEPPSFVYGCGMLDCKVWVKPHVLHNTCCLLTLVIVTFVTAPSELCLTILSCRMRATAMPLLISQLIRC